MALSYFNESEAPRDFRVSSTESDGHYKKCLLCYTVKMNFYCPDCVRAGNFVHSSMPYADRSVPSPLLRSNINEFLYFPHSDYLCIDCELYFRLIIRRTFAHYDLFESPYASKLCKQCGTVVLTD